MIRAVPLLLAALLLAAAFPLLSQSTSLKDDLNAYHDLYELAINQGKHLDPNLIDNVLRLLESHFAEYPEAYFKAGDLYFRLGDNDKAIQAYRNGMAADGGHKAAYQRRIIEVLFMERKSEQAYEVNQEILRDHPDDPEARGMEASFRLDKGETDAAIAELQSVLETLPDSFVVHYNLGRAYFKKGDLDGARQQFEKALEISPAYRPARVALAQLALRRGDLDAALKYAGETLKTNPDDQIALLIEAAALVRKGSFDAARSALEQLLKKNPENKDALLELGVLDMNQKRYAEAEEPFRIAYALDPSNLHGLAGMIELQFAQDHPDQAVQLAAAEMARQPQRAELRKLLADTEARAKQYEKAIADYQPLVDAFKNAPQEEADVCSRMALAYAATGNLQKAIESMQLAVQLAPAKLAYAVALAEFYDHAGKPEQAVAEYRDALKIDPNNALAMNNLAYLLANGNGDLDEALQLALQARQRLPEMNAALDTLGWVYFKRKQFPEAVATFRDLNNRAKDNPTFHHHYAMALAQNGDKAGALAELKTALDCHPAASEEAEIREMIAKLQ